MSLLLFHNIVPYHKYYVLTLNLVINDIESALSVVNQNDMDEIRIFLILSELNSFCHDTCDNLIMRYPRR